jgi:hypothetical protein
VSGTGDDDHIQDQAFTFGDISTGGRKSWIETAARDVAVAVGVALVVKLVVPKVFK